ncbi:MAG: DegV family protein [Clostridiales bacterium]|nr:DegV family protein [Clostridiales bacterium]
MARKFVIITDSACDLPDSYYTEHDIDCVPLGFIMDGVTYGGEEGENLDVKEFYARLRGGAMPKTFQITAEQAKKHIAPHIAAGKDVLVVSFSSGLSGTYNSYISAAKEIPSTGARVAVVDSRCASMGQGLFVDYIVRYADTGATLNETIAYAEDLKGHICHYFTVDNLFHLKRGGRVSAATAIVGTMLKIKPVLHVDENGHLIAIGKAMGRKKSISALVEHMKALKTMGEDDPIFISHGDCMEDVEYLLELINPIIGNRRVVINEIGSVIGTHSGAGTVALFFKGQHR